MSSVVTSPATAPRKGSFHRFWRALRQLFLEIIGTFFAVFGIVWLHAALRSWKSDIAHWSIVAAVAIGFALLFFFFAFSSFRRARRL